METLDAQPGSGERPVTAIRRNLTLVIAGLLLVVGLVGWYAAYDLRSDPALDNRAIIDPSATAEVKAEVTQGLIRVLTYDHTKPDVTREAAATVLAGDARSEYDTLFKDLTDRAAEQKLSLTASVAVAGVRMLDDTSAELLVFLDQSSQRDDGEASVSAAQLSIQAQLRDGSWRITGLDPL